MGYDMRWRKVDDSEKVTVAAAREAFYAAISERGELPREEAGRLNRERFETNGSLDDHSVYDGRTDRYRAAQDKVEVASEAMDAAEQSYFRLNIWGMGRWRQVMSELGMAFDAGERPDWPAIALLGQPAPDGQQ